MNEEMIRKAKEAKSAGDLLALAQEYGIEDFTEKDAEDLYTQLHASGELADEELENVAGGGCTKSVNGKNYRMVTCDTKCFTDQFDWNPHSSFRTDQLGLRLTWLSCASGDHVCGKCTHLGLKSGIGYCEVEFG